MAKLLSPKELLFVKAYIGTAAGNASKAAELAGWTPKNAHQQGSRLLTRPHVQAALHGHAQRTGITTERALANVSGIANAPPAKITSADILKANELILKVNGALNDKRGDARVTVNIGFLTSAPSDFSHTAISAVVLPTQPQVLGSDE